MRALRAPYVFLSIVGVCLFIFVSFVTISSANADVFQFSDDDPNRLKALAVAAAHEALAEVNVEDKVNLDENLAPQDFGFENLGFLPNNPLYVFKSLRRGVTSALTFDPAEQAELKLQFAAEKLLEAKELAGRDGTSSGTVARALDSYERELAKADKEIREAAGIPEERKTELLTSSLDYMTKYQKIMGAFDRTLPPEAFDTVQDARTATADGFNAAFVLGAPEAVSEKLVEVLDAQSGSEFKHFKNAEILKEVADRVPDEAKAALETAEENVLTKLQLQLEQSDEAQKAVFADFVKDVGGNEVRHLEVVSDLEVRPVSDEVREAITAVKEEVLAKTEDRLEGLAPEQKEKFLAHLADGTLDKVRILKEIENNVAEGVLAGVEKVRAQATEQLKKKIETASADDTEKQKLAASIERYHDARSIAVLEEIAALIPDDKKEFFTSLKMKAAEEIKRDIDGARNAGQRDVIYKALAGDHPEYVAALDSFEKDAGATSAVRGVLDGLRSAQYRRVEERVENIKDEGRLQKYEGEYERYQEHFNDAPRTFDFRTVFEDKRGVFESPERATQKVSEARAVLARLTTALETLPYDVGFEDGHFDPAMKEIERMRASAEKKLGVAETSLEYNDIGRAYGEAQAALRLAENGLNMTEGYKHGKRREKETLSFLPQDYYTDPEASATRRSRTQGFTLYNANEFSQLCAFIGGFLKGKTRCEFSDGRVLEVPNGAFPFRVPSEFTPKKLDEPKGEDGEPTPVGCPPPPAIYGDFCQGGKVVYQYDKRGCAIAPRCEYERPKGGAECRGYISESSCRQSGCVWYTEGTKSYCDDEAHGRTVWPDPLPLRRLHPKDPTLCGGKENYQCREGYYCDNANEFRTSGYSRCVAEDTVTCQAYFEGWVYEKSGTGGSQCVKRNASGCTDPFVYKTKDQCESGQKTDVDGYRGDANSCPGFAYSRWDARGVRYCQLNYERRCDYQYPSYLTNGANYSVENCPEDDTTACSRTETESACRATKGCTWGVPAGENAKRCFSGKTSGVCPAMPTVNECPAGQKKVLSYNSPECGDYYTCVADTTEKSTWVSHTWKFSDGSTSSMILNRADQEYTDFIASVEAQCVKIPKAKFAWKPGAGDDRADNWQSFGIPDCSGAAATYQCGNNLCEANETAQSCSVDCGGTGSNTSQCSDGKDNDGDGKVDYPADPECYGTNDWDEKYGATTGGGGGMQRCFYPNVTKNGAYVGWTIWCESDYVNCHYGDPSGKAFDTAGVSLGAPSSCESGWAGGGGGCGMYTTESQCKAMGGCEWQYNACSPKSGFGATSCPSDQYWDGSKCTAKGGSCAAYQYWDGSKCASSKEACITAGGTWNGAINYCATPSQTNTQTGTDYSKLENDCRASGGTWDYANYYCKPKSTTTTTSSSGTGGTTSSSGSTTSSSGMQKCFYTNATKNGAPVGHTVWCESDYVNCKVGSSTGESFSTSGVSLGAPSSCESGSTSGSGSSSSGGGCGMYATESQCVPMSACKWENNACVYNTTTSSSYSSWQSCPTNQYWDTRTSSCKSNESACAEAGGTWSSSSNYCQMPGTSSYSGGSSSGSTGTYSSGCSSTQYWDSATQSCQPMSSSSGGGSSCPSGQYWSGTSCVTGGQ